MNAPTGTYNLVVDAVETLTRTGADYLVVTFKIIDAGPGCGAQLKKWYRIDPGDDHARRQMYALVQATDLPLDERGNFEAASLVQRVLEADVGRGSYDAIDPKTGYMTKRETLRVLAERRPQNPISADAIAEAALADPIAPPANNQGRVRPTNVAPYEVDGLRFRSGPEIHFYRALANLGVTFAPLAVFLRGSARIEPDFILYRGGKLVVVEIDGPMHTESEEEAAARTGLFTDEGAIVLHVPADDCDTYESAVDVARSILKDFP